ncbi:MAG: EAL domain-containing protein, partial [Enterobacteriaceae bacterium]
MLQRFNVFRLQVLKKRLATWWGIPLLLGVLLIPIAGYLSPAYTDTRITLLLLTLPVCLALLMIYDIVALPGIFAGLFIYYRSKLSLDPTLVVLSWYFFSLTICWLLSSLQKQRMKSSLFRVMSLNWLQIAGLLFFLPLLLVIGLQWIVNYNLVSEPIGFVAGEGSSPQLLLNYQGVVLACLAGLWPIYHFLRLLLRPNYFHVIYRRIMHEKAHNVKIAEFAIWLLLLFSLVYCLTFEYSDQHILLSNYPLTLLLPMMLYGAVRLGFIASSTIWLIAVWIIVKHYPGLFYSSNTDQSLVFALSLLIMFTLSLTLLSIISSHQRIMHSKARHLSLVDPLSGLPNLRWLIKDLYKNEESVVCFIRTANLDILSRAYGIHLRIQFKQHIEQTLATLLKADEKLYQLPDNDLVVRLNGDSGEQEINRIQDKLNQFRLLWNGLPLHPHYGLGYGKVRSTVKHLNTFLGELSSLAEISLSSGLPESTCLSEESLQVHIQNKVATLQRIQQALDDQGFTLLAEPVQGFRGDHFYHLQLFLTDEQGKHIPAETFLPVVREFGIYYDVDHWLLQQGICFIASHRQQLPSLCFALTLYPETLCRPLLLHDICDLVQQYQIEPYQLILKAAMSGTEQNNQRILKNLHQLREKGFRIAIDGFSTGYGEHCWLAEMQVDFIYIPGSFMTNLDPQSVGYPIVASICQVARS